MNSMIKLSKSFSFPFIILGIISCGVINQLGGPQPTNPNIDNNGSNTKLVDPLNATLASTTSNAESLNTPTNNRELSNESWNIDLVQKTLISANFAIVLDNQDAPHILYTAGGGDHNILRYATNNSGTWNIDEVDQDVEAFNQSLALDSNNQPHISYCRYTCPTLFCFCNALKYGYYDGMSWQLSIVNEGNSFLGTGASIALDESNLPHLAFFNGFYVSYLHYDGNQWEGTQSKLFGVEFAAFPEIGLDSNNNPHIMFANPNRDNKKINYFHYTGTEWIEESLVDGISSSFRLDSNSLPHVLYCNKTNEAYTLNYEVYKNDKWNNELLKKDKVYCNGRLALDKFDNPHIVYYDYSNRKLMYQYYNGSQWKESTIFTGEITTGMGAPEPYFGVAIEIDNNSLAHILFSTKTIGDLVNSLYYAMETGR